MKFRAALLVVYALFILIGSVIPLEIPTVMDRPCDKILHAVAYFFLAVLVCSAFAASGKKSLFLPAWGYATFYGIVMEILQYGIPYRSADLYDVLYNSGGAASGAIVAWLWYRTKSLR